MCARLVMGLADSLNNRWQQVRHVMFPSKFACLGDATVAGGNEDATTVLSAPDPMLRGGTAHERIESLADDGVRLMLGYARAEAHALDVPLVAPRAAPAVLDQPVRLHGAVLVLLVAVAHLPRAAHGADGMQPCVRC